MTKHYCDICNKEVFSPTQAPILVAPTCTQMYDLCGDCRKAINDAKDNAEIKTVKELRRTNNE